MSRVQELYEIIKKAQDELEDIRANCKHIEHKECNYMWAPGHISVGHMCDYCGHYLGEYKTFADWLPSYTDTWFECMFGAAWKLKTLEIKRRYPDKFFLYENREKINTYGDKLFSQKEFEILLEIIL